MEGYCDIVIRFFLCLDKRREGELRIETVSFELDVL